MLAFHGTLILETLSFYAFLPCAGNFEFLRVLLCTGKRLMSFYDFFFNTNTDMETLIFHIFPELRAEFTILPCIGDFAFLRFFGDFELVNYVDLTELVLFRRSEKSLLVKWTRFCLFWRIFKIFSRLQKSKTSNLL